MGAVDAVWEETRVAEDGVLRLRVELEDAGRGAGREDVGGGGDDLVSLMAGDLVSVMADDLVSVMLLWVL